MNHLEKKESTCPECQFETPRYPHEKYSHHKDCSRATDEYTLHSEAPSTTNVNGDQSPYSVLREKILPMIKASWREDAMTAIDEYRENLAKEVESHVDKGIETGRSGGLIRAASIIRRT